MENKTTEEFNQEPEIHDSSHGEADDNQYDQGSSGTVKIVAIAAVSLVLIGIVIVAAIFLFSKKTVQAAPAAPEVEVVEVEQKDVPVYSKWTGTTDGYVNTEIRSQISGYLLKQHYTEGSVVHKGQLMFEIDPQPFQTALDEVRGKLAEAVGKQGQADSQYAQTLAQIAQAQAQVEQAQANVMQTQAQSELTKAQLAQSEANQRKTQLDVNKYRPLREQKAVTQQELDNAVEANSAAAAQINASKAQIQAAGAQIGAAKAAVGTAQAQVNAAKAQSGAAKAAANSAKAAVQSAQADVRTAEFNLSLTRIVSPIDGIAGISTAQVGNLLSPTSGALTTVSTVDPIKVYFNVSEQEYLATARQNQKEADRRDAFQKLQLELVLSDGTTYPETGRFFVADRQVDQKTGTIKLAGIFSNPNNILRPGQYAEIRAVTSTKSKALLVPQRAVTELQGRNQVAVVGDDNKIDMRTVTTGDKIDSKWVILDGLKLGEKVVVAGVQKVAPGTTVTTKPYAPPADPAK